MFTHHMLLHVDHCVPCQSISKLDLRKELRNMCVCVCVLMMDKNELDKLFGTIQTE